MHATTIRAVVFRALILLCAGTGDALATPNIGVLLDNWCTKAPLQSAAPQQSRPYTASGSACTLCHTSSNASANNLNARGTATLTCSGSGTATTCGAAVNAYCVATPPAASSIAAPPVGTSVALGQSVTFQAGGTSSSPDGFVLSYAWLFSGGQASASGFQAVVPMTVAGAITATLEVRNTVGMLATGTAPTRVVTVTGAANQPPVATISAPAANVSIAAGGTVNFQGSGTDPNNNVPLTYRWVFAGGTPASSTAQNPGAVTYAAAGTFTASFTVVDSLGLASAAVTRTVTVTAAGNQPPVATISAPAANVSIAAGGTVTFQGSGTDPNNNVPLTYRWVFTGGTPASSTAQNPGAIRYSTAGTFTASFTVVDSLGLASAAVTRTVTVTGGTGNQPPVATIRRPTANVSIAAGGTVNFRGSGTDPDNNLPLTYQWVFTGGTPASSTAQTPGTVTYRTAGTFTASFTVIDSLGLASAAVTRTVTVTGPANQPPVATISSPAANVTIAAGGTVNFQGSGTDPDNNTPLTYRWVFTGGTPASSTAQNPGAVTYATAGTFTASFTVVDSLGLASATVTRTVTVAAASQSPTASIDAPTINVSVLPGGAVTFRGSGVSPTNRLPLTYLWTFAGGTPSSSTSQNPGTVRFNTVGKFTVSLVVTDRDGRKSVAVIRVVTVAAANQPAPRIGTCRPGEHESEDD